MPILPATDINDTFNFALARIMQKVESYTNYESGWEFHHVEKVFIEISQFQPPTGAEHMPLPKDLAAKKGVLNPANDDNKCFQWAILAALHPVEKNAEYINQYRIEFPIQADEVILRRFERQNPTITLCICEWRNHCLSPIYVTDRDDIEGRKIIDLILITICYRLKKTPQADRMPSNEKGNAVYMFKKRKCRMQVPYYFVADFEALVMDIPPTDADKDKKTKKKANGNDAINNPRASKL
ncbi:hypothetical protein C1646_776315 [Rhizophagus diaphanus]|nr:hypothetical protein C1646_776315 [Rhizophagus diaphanus] [Rhizophagus sp. MUCL 43196]